MLMGCVLFITPRLMFTSEVAPKHVIYHQIKKLEDVIRGIMVVGLKILFTIILTGLLFFGYVQLKQLLFPESDFTPEGLTLQLFLLIVFFIFSFSIFFGFLAILKKEQVKKRVVSGLEWLSGPWLASLTSICLIILLELIAKHYVSQNEYGINNRFLGVIPFAEQHHTDVIYSDNLYLLEAKNAFQTYQDSRLNFDIPRDMRGKYLNIINHIRVTTNQPQIFSNTIYLFGGSSMECLEGADWMTLPSFFQRRVNEIYPNRYQVVNMGVIGITSTNQTERLKTVVLKQGDMVIFFDGNNDVNSVFQTDFFIFPDINNGPFGVKLAGRLLEYSTFYDIFLAPYNYLQPITHNLTKQKENITILLNNYFSSLSEAKEYSEQHGAHFFHFLQPTLFTISERSDYENKLILSYRYSPYGWADLHSKSYQALMNFNQTLLDEGIFTFDITDTFEPKYREPGQEYFYDQIHVNFNGNDLLARRIFEILLPYFPETHIPHLEDQTNSN